jgi:L-fucose isomerase-like protein
MRIHQIQSKRAKDAARKPSAPPAPKKPARRVTFGLIVGNRGFFPGHLARDGRAEMLQALKDEGFDAVVLKESATNYGAIESRDEAKAYADLFKQNRDRIDGIIVTLPNFGDERGVAETIRLAGLNVPVLVHASMDEPK